MFYGPMKETGEEIKVEETTFEALNMMIKYIYQPPGGEPFNLSHVGCPQEDWRSQTPPGWCKSSF